MEDMQITVGNIILQTNRDLRPRALVERGHRKPSIIHFEKT